MPLSSTQQQTYDTWVHRFVKKNIPKEHLIVALESKPDAVTIDALYANIKRWRPVISAPWQLVMLSASPAWVNQPLRGVDRTTKDDFNYSLIHWAAASGNADCVFAVIEKYGIDKEIRNKNGETIAHLAAYTGKIESLIAILQKYPDLENLLTKEGESVEECAIDASIDYALVINRMLLEWKSMVISKASGFSQAAEALKSLYKRGVPGAKTALIECNIPRPPILSAKRRGEDEETQPTKRHRLFDDPKSSTEQLLEDALKREQRLVEKVVKLEEEIRLLLSEIEKLRTDKSPQPKH